MLKQRPEQKRPIMFRPKMVPIHLDKYLERWNCEGFNLGIGKMGNGSSLDSILAYYYLLLSIGMVDPSYLLFYTWNFASVFHAIAIWRCDQPYQIHPVINKWFKMFVLFSRLNADKSANWWKQFKNLLENKGWCLAHHTSKICQLGLEKAMYCELVSTVWPINENTKDLFKISIDFNFVRWILRTCNPSRSTCFNNGLSDE